MILITTPTGHIGSQLIVQLLSTSQKVRVFARDASKLPPEVKARMEVVQGSLDHAEDLARAFANVDTLFYVIPPSMQFESPDAYYQHFGELTVRMLREKKVRRVVFVSGTGVDLNGNAGAVTSSVHAENMLRDSGAHVRILHCGTFMENLFHAAASIKAAAQFSATCPPDAKLPWVATKDIASVARRLLVDTTWDGVSAAGILGPVDLSYGDVAEIMTEVFGKKISYNQISVEALMSNAQKYGATLAAAQSLADIQSSMARGTFNLVKRDSSSSSPTRLHDWLKDHASVFGF